MTVEKYDIAVLGGGPAGAFAAHGLCREGFRVALVDPDETPSRIEGVSPRVVAILTGAGFGLDALDISEPVERRSHWSGAASSANAEHLADRRSFDSALRSGAADAGVNFIKDRVARLETGDAGVKVTLAGGGVLEAPLAVDARGRRAPRKDDCARGPKSISASAWDIRPSTADRPLTTVIPAPDGWVWTAEPGDGRRWLQVVFDASTLDGSGEQAVRAAMQTVLDSQSVTAVLGDDAAPGGAPLVRACETIFAGPKLTPPVIRIGDAATGLDPLSGHGMFWAISSALSAVPIVRAIGEGGAAADLAHRFYNERVHETFFRQSRVGRDFYRLEQRWSDRPFWSQRNRWPDDRPIHETAGGCEVKRAVVVDNGCLTEADVLVTPSHPGGVAWVAGVPIVPIFKDLKRRTRPPSMETLFAELSSQATPEQARAVVAWLRQQNLIAAKGDSVKEGHI